MSAAWIENFKRKTCKSYINFEKVHKWNKKERKKKRYKTTVVIHPKFKNGYMQIG